MSNDSSSVIVDWDALRALAIQMTERSYAPYSGVRVGAAAVCEDGSIVTGCNVENASIGIGICAEVNLCGHLVAAGGPQPLALAVVAGDHRPIAPCGRCRQFLYEFGGDQLLIELERGVVTLGELLPDAFGPDDVVDRKG
ncbi:cytidine deaminase [soil metagenome]